MKRTKLLAMFGGLAVMASALAPSLALAHERDDGRFQRQQAQERVQEQRRLEFEHARFHAEHPYATPWQHAAMHRWLRVQQRQFNRRERREDRRYWRAERNAQRRDRDGRWGWDGYHR